MGKDASQRAGRAVMLRWAVATFTIIDVGAFTPPRDRTGAMVLWAPLASLPLAVGAAGLTALNLVLDLPWLAAVAVVALLAAGTRAMHLDAIADVTDALGGGWTPERAREILHRGDVGPMGVVALVLMLAAQIAAIAQLAATPRGWLLVGVAVLAARAAVTLACRRGLTAMPGSRLGASVAGSIKPAALTVSLVAATVLVVLAAWPQPWAGLVALLAWAGCAALVHRTSKRFGGVNGDVMGATVEVASTILLVGLAVLVR